MLINILIEDLTDIALPDKIQRLFVDSDAVTFYLLMLMLIIKIDLI